MKGSIRQIPWYGQLFILMGLFLIGETVFGQLSVMIITWMYPNSGVFNLISGMSNIHSADMVSATQRDILIWYQSLTTVGRFIGVAALFLYLNAQSFTEGLDLNKSLRPTTGLLIIPIMVAVVSVTNVVNDWNQHLSLPASMKDLETSMRQMEDMAKVLTEVFLSTTSVTGLLINILVIGALAAIAEEIFFRGIIQRMIHRGTGNMHVAVWIAAFFFSFIHFQFFGFFPRLLLGALIGYLYAWSGSLWSSITAHFINNSLSVIAWFCVEKGWMGENVAESSSITAAIISLPFVFLLLVLFRRSAKQTETENGKGLDDGVFNRG